MLDNENAVTRFQLRLYLLQRQITLMFLAIPSEPIGLSLVSSYPIITHVEFVENVEYEMKIGYTNIK